MEEDVLMKERLQAITDKKKVQEDTARKRLEIDKEKLRLQYLKKKAVREQWLLEGQGAPCGTGHEGSRQQIQEQQEQIRTLQSNIYRMEIEVEALERQEMMISTNEGFILKRLKTVEKSAEDIIKAVKSRIQEESTEQVPSTNTSTPYRSPRLQKHNPGPNVDQPTRALYAMEINVQRDKRTGESVVLSKASIPPQQAQKNGVKVYDDGRRSVYAVHPGGQDFIDGVNKLSPDEVEQLLRTAPKQPFRNVPECHGSGTPRLSATPPNARRPVADQMTSESNGVQGLSPTIPKITCNETGQFWERGSSMVPSYIPVSCSGVEDRHYGQNIRHGQRCSSKSGDNEAIQRPQNPKHTTGDTPTGTPKEPPRDSPNHKNPPLSDSQNSRGDLLNTMAEDLDSLKPVTMIFMGYQTISDGAHVPGHDGAIRAELVIIASDDDDEGHRGVVCHPSRSPGPIQHPPVAQGSGSVTSRPGILPAHFQEAKLIPPTANMATDGDVMTDASTAATREGMKALSNET
ncbi:palmdelphin isoform X2 [Brienomyrus brachyistius]|nr:palmdelphin isoform X2 [Brienomyrus brachyistius]XP_048845934.1 palmdelphin isoform X2 [Brienomyrus brachyistius]XP_048845935.1 palmdelphin isoform X2 [Brienomyrus brachyistius]